MNNVKKWLSLSLAGAMLMGALAGCGGGRSASSPSPSGSPAPSESASAPTSTILRWGTDSEPTGFDPHTNSEEASLRVMNQLYETLVSRNEDMTFYGRLAESWEIPDETTYIFHLRQGVKFHSGREMTADDVVYTFDRILGKTEAGDIGALGSKASYYGGVASVEAVDPYTVKFTLAEPNAAFLGNLTSNYGAIVDKDVIAEKGDLMRADGGTGPFQLGEWLPDNYVTITKFSDYWEADRVKLDGITYFLIGDEAARLAATYADATTAKVAVLAGKAVGPVYTTLAAADLRIAVTGCTVSALEPSAAVSVLYKDEIDASDNIIAATKAKTAAYTAEVCSAASAVAAGAADMSCDAANVRASVVAALELLSTKRAARLPKKHGNMAL